MSIIVTQCVSGLRKVAALNPHLQTGWLILALAAGLSARAAAPVKGARDGVLVPYAGVVQGELPVVLEGDPGTGTWSLIQETEAKVVSSHLGKGVQIYEPDGFELELRSYSLSDLYWLPVSGSLDALDQPDTEVKFPGLSVRGSTTTIAANGDALRVGFDLEAVFVGGSACGATYALYIGSYTILAGGTGRCAYDGCAGDLGSGKIVGGAVLTPVVMEITAGGEAQQQRSFFAFTFEHTFEGTLRVGTSGKGR